MMLVASWACVVCGIADVYARDNLPCLMTVESSYGINNVPLWPDVLAWAVPALHRTRNISDVNW